MEKKARNLLNLLSIYFPSQLVFGPLVIISLRFRSQSDLIGFSKGDWIPQDRRFYLASPAAPAAAADSMWRVLIDLVACQY